MRKIDQLQNRVFSIVRKAGEPLETKEVEHALKNHSRVKILYRLNDLRGRVKISGKQVGSGKGTWIWWI